jgi:hypothetical protein
MNRSKMLKYGIWALAPLIGAAAMLAFLYFRDHGGESFEPPAAVGEQGKPVSAEKIQEARDFKEWPLYWLGESSQSLALTSIDEFTPDRGFPTMNSVDLIYGTCTQQPGQEACTPPLSIVVEPLCFTPPERIAGVERDSPFDFRGAKALWVDEIQLGIWTGDSAVFIFGSKERVLKAAEEISPLGNIEVAVIDSELPPPNFESCPKTPIYPVSTLVPEPPRE